MADSNDDLLDGDGDLVDGEFDLDGADEDALLADDYDEVKVPSKSQRTSTTRNQKYHGNNRDQATEDEDAIELGVIEEDLEDEKPERWTKNEVKPKERSKFEYNSKIGDSDEEDVGNRDSARFKTERNIMARTRNTSAIPETLDGVVVNRSAPSMRGGKAGGVGGNGTKLGGRLQPQQPPVYRPNRNNIVNNHSGAMNNGLGVQPRNNFMRQQGHGHSGGQQLLPPPLMQQPPPPQLHPHHPHHHHHHHHQQQPPRLMQPSNIHVNPHFRPRPPLSMPGWQASPNNYPPPQQPSYPPQFNNNFPSPLQPRPVWNDGPPQNYYHEPHPHPPYQNYQDNYYNGPPPPQEPVYYNQQSQHQNMNPPNAPPYQQSNNWENQNYYPPNQDMYHNQPPMIEPHQQQVHPPFIRPPNHIRPQFQRGPPNFPGKIRPNKIRASIKRDGHLMNSPMSNKVPVKLQRLDVQRKVSRNLHQVQTIDNLPASVATGTTTTTTTTTTPTLSQNIIEPEEEDEEMKEYRMKIEEQKKLREEILRKKEEKRAEAAQQRQQREKMEKLENSSTNNLLTKSVLSLQNNKVAAASTKEPTAPENQFKMVRVRTKDGTTIVRKLSLAVIQRLKKVQPDGKMLIKTVKVSQENQGLKTATTTTTAPGSQQLPSASSTVASSGPSQTVDSKTVAIENLSATTTKKQLFAMAKQVGAVQSVQFDTDSSGKAKIKFETHQAAGAFIQKFQRKMVDLSMITITFLPE